MKLLTKKILVGIPRLDRDDEYDAIVHVKFFDPCGRWTWYAVAYDPEEEMFFGYVVGPFDETCDEWGYFGLAELKSFRGRLGLGIERDMYFKPQLMSVACPAAQRALGRWMPEEGEMNHA
ncbi:hypothetical protein LCGC14_2741900 [marine sediment metagenome]|uniref:DUF2958 domain-containing protein n=1 Tax=marine sediment metagenome TaxID=412755 RepID=A0A0F9BD35_9ZZZZ